MKIFTRVLIILAVLSGFLLAACSAGSGSARVPEDTPVYTQTSTASPFPTPALLTPIPILPMNTPGIPLTETQPVASTPISSTVIEPTPCTPDRCVYQDVFFLSRPIDETLNDQVDVTYRFGST